MKESPFTAFFRNAITAEKDRCEGAGDSGEENNDFYSPSCFKCIRDVMHLFPLWSRAMYHAALRGTVLAKSPPSMTNAKVESYFKNLKSSTLKRQTRLWPIQIVREQLQTVLGKLKEMHLPQSINIGQKRRSAKFLHDEEEKWNRRKKRPKYSDPGVSRRLLTPKKLVMSKNSETCVTEKKHGHDISRLTCEGRGFPNVSIFTCSGT